MRKNINKQFEYVENILDNVDFVIALEYSIWIKNKAILIFNTNIPSFLIANNYIYWCNLGINIGSEQNKIRPVLITKTKKNSPMCTILPLTTKRRNDTRWYHIDLENYNSTILIEQLRNISKIRIISPLRIKGQLAKITLNDWNKIDYPIKNYYSLTELK